MAVIEDIEGKIWLALRARLEQFTECAIMWPMEVYEPDASQAHLIVEPVTVDPDIASSDYGCGEENRGFLNIRIMTPLQWNYAQSSGLKGRVAALFPAGWQGAYGGASVLVWRKPKGLGTPFREAAWNRQDLRVDWRSWG